MNSKLVFQILSLSLAILIVMVMSCTHQGSIAKLSFYKKDVNFGVVNLRDSTILCTNTIKNIGHGALTVVDSKTTCECTVINLDNATPILPGETRFFSIQFSPQDTGNLKLPIMLRSNDPEIFSTFYLVGRVVEK